MSTTPDIWCVGGAGLDWIGRAAAPLSTEGSTPGGVEARLGGVALNIALGLARAGRRVALVGARGEDAAGEALAHGLKAAGVEDRLIRIEGATGAYLAIEDQTGALALAISDAAGLEGVAPAALAEALAGRPLNAPLLFDANLTVAQIAALPDAPILAANAVSAVKAPRLRAALPRLTALFCNAAEAAALLGAPPAGAAEAAGALAALGPEMVFVTDGPRPAAAAEGGAVFEAAPKPLTHQGETGAGDAFTAAAFDRLTQGGDAEAALKAGLAAAAAHLEPT